MVNRSKLSQRFVGRRAFTLIELLVVIAIIALLIAILLPSLEAARCQSKKSACLAQIKNIATSSRVYEADDPSGWGIPVHPKQFTQCSNGTDIQQEGLCNTPIFVGAYEWGGKSGIGRDDFISGSSDPLNSKYGTKAGFGPSTRPMNDILFPGGFADASAGGLRGGIDRSIALADTKLDLGLFHCPGDVGPPRGAHCPDWIKNRDRSSYDHFGTSYAANIFMTGPGGGGGGEMRTNSPYLRPVSRVPTPARTLYFEENIGRWAWSAKNEIPNCRAQISEGVDPGPTKTIEGWHCKDWTFNRAFVDAHAETQKIWIEGTVDKEGYAEHYRFEVLSSNPDFGGSECVDGPGQGSSYGCITVRGDGWQKDTLPASPICTGLNYSLGGRPSYEDCVVGS